MGTLEHTYRHGVDAVFAKVTDPDHLKRRAEASGHRNVEVSVDERDGETVVRLARDIESDIPSFAKKFVDPVNRVVDVLTWRASGDARKGTYHVEVSDRIRVDGEMALEPTADGCVYRDTFTPEVDVPLIGKRIAKIVEKETGEAIEADHRWTEQELDAEGSS
jgi:hypothetical protein